METPKIRVHNETFCTSTGGSITLSNLYHWQVYGKVNNKIVALFGVNVLWEHS